MMGIDNKYGRVTTEFGNIGEDEPVVVFRARDCVLHDVLPYYHSRCRVLGSPEKHLALIRKSQEQVLAWQKAHPNEVRVPRSDDYDPKR